MLDLLKNSCEIFPERNSFFINETFYSYRQFADGISKVRSVLEEEIAGHKLVGILIDDQFSFETYTSIFGVLFCGSGFVPININDPTDRIKIISDQCELRVILSTFRVPKIHEIEKNCNVKCLITAQLPDSEINLALPHYNENQIAYVLFTSGSTGVPKGVQINWKNVNALMDSFFSLGYLVDENDRFLQMFDLAFDFSIMCYFIPLSIGACVYTISTEGIKYSNVYTTLEDHKITFAAMVPSFLSYLRPYFSEILLNDLKYSFFCGEALFDDITAEWAECVPNALIQNAYGPTEATVFCTIYNWQRGETHRKHINGTVPIGKPILNTEIIIVDDELNELPAGHKGELCIAGGQLTIGYLKTEDNRQAFFTKKINDKEIRFYRTGDLAYFDGDGDLNFLGRADNQIKLHGFRIELGEIEFHARKFTYPNDVVAVFYKNKLGIERIHLFVEGYKNEVSKLHEFLEANLPYYMIPNNISIIDTFPLNKNGKVDRKGLLHILQNKARSK